MLAQVMLNESYCLIFKGMHMKKIIWAVDISHDPTYYRNIVKELNIWAKKVNGLIYPVSVVSASLYNLGLPTEYPWQNNYKKSLLLLFQNYLKKAHASKFKSPQVIMSPSFSNRHMAQELIQYAIKENASYIFAHTRMRSRWNPLRLGGFAETLAANSPIPVLLMNLKTKPASRMRSVLFPTDLSSISHESLQQLLPVVDAFNPKLILYNQIEEIPMNLPLTASLSAVQLSELETIRKELEKERDLKIQDWVKQLQDQGVNSSFKIQRQKTFLGKDILTMAHENKADLIVLTNDTGIFPQTALSSTIKDIIMHCTCPVLIYSRAKKSTLQNIKSPISIKSSLNETSSSNKSINA